jgi:hypothetical protein
MKRGGDGGDRVASLISRGMPMTDNTELQRVMRLRRLGRQIAASLPADLDRELAFQVHGYGELPVGAPSRMSKPASSKASLRAQPEAALANYHGPVTVCPPAGPPEPHRDAELDLADDDEVDEDAVIGR